MEEKNPFRIGSLVMNEWSARFCRVTMTDGTLVFVLTLKGRLADM